MKKPSKNDKQNKNDSENVITFLSADFLFSTQLFYFQSRHDGLKFEISFQALKFFLSTHIQFSNHKCIKYNNWL